MYKNPERVIKECKQYIKYNEAQKKKFKGSEHLFNEEIERLEGIIKVAEEQLQGA